MEKGDIFLVAGDAICQHHAVFGVQRYLKR
jgi:hypothetical protein